MTDSMGMESFRESQPIQPFPSRRLFEPRFLAETFDMQNEPGARLGRYRRDSRWKQLHEQLVDGPLQIEYSRHVQRLSPSAWRRTLVAKFLQACEELRQDQPGKGSEGRRRTTISELHWEMVGRPIEYEDDGAESGQSSDSVRTGPTDWLFSCSGGADAEAICRAVGMSEGLYADMSAVGWGNKETMLNAVSNAMPRSVHDWDMLHTLIQDVMRDLESAVFILRNPNHPSSPNVARFAAIVLDVIEEMSPLQGPVAVVLAGWDQPILEVDPHWPSAPADHRLPVHQLSL